MPTLLIFATGAEAAATLKGLDASRASDNLFDYQGGRILITGMGSANAAASVARHARKDETLVNIGVCGGIRPGLKYGDIWRPSTVYKGAPANLDEWSLRIHGMAHPTVALGNGDGSVLITTDYPLRSPQMVAAVQPTADIVDMEGYGCAIGAQHLGINLTMIKLVSDTCSEADPLFIVRRLPELSEMLFDAWNSAKSSS